MQTEITIDKLLQNDDFIQWNVSGKTSSFQDWNKIIDEASSTDKKIYEASIKILDRLLSIDVEGHIEVKTEEFIDSSYIKLLEKFASEKKVTKVISINRIMRYAAAILLPIAISSLGYFYFTQQPQDLFENHLLATEYNPSKIQIRTADGKYYSLPNKKKKSWITENGLFVSISNTGLKINKADSFEANANDKYTILVPRSNQYQVELEDGTNIEMNSASQLAFGISNSKIRKVSLDGEAYFDVARDETRPFVVHTNRMDIQVLGTEFNVSTYASPHYYSTTLVEGSIQITTANGNKKLIEPSEQARILVDDYKIEVIDVDVQNVVAWTSGRTVFRNESLEVLANKLSRWYDLEFIVDENLKDIKFNGTLTKEKKLLHV
ncbi:MAG: FecR domain-containing protein, partial [Flavobacteriales bacterium]|nr:FecR domain-containing protein [Flavobacteriales bacterium]